MALMCLDAELFLDKNKHWEKLWKKKKKWVGISVSSCRWDNNQGRKGGWAWGSLGPQATHSSC